jgi:hypothetical protein
MKKIKGFTAGINPTPEERSFENKASAVMVVIIVVVGLIVVFS